MSCQRKSLGAGRASAPFFTAVILIGLIAISLGGSRLDQAQGAAGGGGPRGFAPPSEVCEISPPPAAGASIPFDGVCDYLNMRDPTMVTQAAIFDNVSGQTYALSTGYATQYTASIAKVDILAKWLNGYQADGVTIPDGIDYSIQYLMQNMIENSNNQAATALFYFGGGCEALTSFNRLIPMTGTQVGCETSDYYGWGNTETTAADQVSLMKAFAYGANQYVQPGARKKAIRNCRQKIRRNAKKQRACITRVNRKFERLARTPILNQAARAYGLSLMENIEPDQSWGLSCGPWGEACDPPNYAPPDPRVTIAHKNGWKTLPNCGPPIDPCPWQVNSTGWVNGRGRDYVLSVLTTNIPAGAQLTDGFNYGINTIQEISRIVWGNLSPGT